MRLLHTSDWHLGRTLHGVDLHQAQEAALDAICQLVESPLDGVPIAAVIVAGDVYDRGVPPVESVKLFERTLARLAAVTTVVVTSGNHDSAVRLGYGSQLFTAQIRLMTDLDRITEPVILTDAEGSVAIYGIPFLDPDHARHKYAQGEELLARSHQAVVGAAVELIRQDFAGRQGAGLRSVIAAHAFVAGAEPSESERSLMVGGVERVAGSTFAGIDYVAMGHLHGPQTPDSPEGTVIRYSGSPLKYSFSEQNHVTSVLLVDVPGSGPITTSTVEIVQPRGMATLRGTLEELLEDPAHEAVADHWLRIYVTDGRRPDNLMDRLKSRFRHTLQVFHEPVGATATHRATTAATEADPRELGASFIHYVRGSEASAAEVDVFVGAYEAAGQVSTAEGLDAKQVGGTG